MPGVVGEGVQRGSCSPVGGPAEPHRPGLAGGSGDRGGAALGDGLLDGVDTLQDRADLGDELGEVDLADAGHGGQQLGLGVAEQAGAKGAVEVDPDDGVNLALKHGHGGCSFQTATVGWHRAGWSHHAAAGL
jgi:hypothetical protein